MDHARFDAQTRLLAMSGPRRALIAALAGGFLQRDTLGKETAKRKRRARKRRRRRRSESTPPCSASCTGCCERETCVSDTSDERCGFDGEACHPCAAGFFCLVGICRTVVPAAGGV